MPKSNITCDRCSASIPADASVCPNCGAPLNEAAATGFETARLDDVFATTRLDSLPDDIETPAPEEVSQPETDEPELAAPESSHAEPTVTASALPEPETEAAPKLAASDSRKEWYQKPVTWIIGGCAFALFACCCVMVAAAAFLTQSGGMSW